MPIGPVRVFTDMRKLKEILEGEGFQEAPLQIWKDGQAFGLVKKLNGDFELHVRGFEDFTIESEVEVSREYLEHFLYREPCYGPILRILSKHEVAYNVIKPLPRDPDTLPALKTKTPWALLVALGLVGSVVMCITLGQCSNK